MKIFKYEVPITDGVSIDMPEGAELLNFAIHNNTQKHESFGWLGQGMIFIHGLSVKTDSQK